MKQIKGPQAFFNRRVGEIAALLSVAPEAVIEAAQDCRLRCSAHKGARRALYMKLDVVLDNLERIRDAAELPGK